MNTEPVVAGIRNPAHARPQTSIKSEIGIPTELNEGRKDLRFQISIKFCLSFEICDLKSEIPFRVRVRCLDSSAFAIVQGELIPRNLYETSEVIGLR